MEKNDIYVVGIAGGSASGKTTIIEKLKKQCKKEFRRELVVHWKLG